jgi:hypothetical protein
LIFKVVKCNKTTQKVAMKQNVCEKEMQVCATKATDKEIIEIKKGNMFYIYRDYRSLVEESKIDKNLFHLKFGMNDSLNCIKFILSNNLNLKNST